MTTADRRGWGPAPTPRSRITNPAFGSTRVQFAPGVHTEVVPLVAELVRRVEAATGEAPVAGHCWGYAPRKVRGSTTTWSNHAWGLAIDYNAPAHPLGKRGTWGQHGPALSKIAADLGFRWGGDYRSRADEMHFEFMGTLADARARVADLRPSSKGSEMLKRGDSGEAVKVFQRALLAWNGKALPQYGADADFGGETEDWVQRFQTAHGLPATGTVGDVTAALLAVQLGGTGGGLSQADADARYARRSHGHRHTHKVTVT